MSVTGRLFGSATASDFEDGREGNLGERGFVRLPGGRSNLLFARRDEVYRVGWRRSRLDVERERLLLCALEASGSIKAGLASERLHEVVDIRTDRVHPTLILVRAAGRAARTSADLLKAASALRSVHRLRPVDLTRQANFSLRRLEDRFQARSGELANRVRPYLRRLGRLLQHEPCVLAHGDLSAANLLVDGAHCQIIDWEAAGLGHQATDLGLLAFHFIDPGRRSARFALKRMLDAYGPYAPDRRGVVYAAILAGAYLTRWRAEHVDRIGARRRRDWVLAPLVGAEAWRRLLPPACRRDLPPLVGRGLNLAKLQFTTRKQIPWTR